MRRITLRHRIERGKKAWQLKIPLGDDRQEIEVAGTQADPPDSLRELLMLHLGHRHSGADRDAARLANGASWCIIAEPVAEMALDT